MTFLKNNWIAVLIFVVVLILVIRYIKETKTASTTVGQQAQTVFSTIANSLSPVPTLTSTLPTNTTITTGFKFGDKIYAKENTVNAYKNPVASAANLDSYVPFKLNDFIGTFSSYSGGFVKVIASNPARTVYVLTSQVYTK